MSPLDCLAAPSSWRGSRRAKAADAKDFEGHPVAKVGASPRFISASSSRDESKVADNVVLIACNRTAFVLTGAPPRDTRSLRQKLTPEYLRAAARSLRSNASIRASNSPFVLWCKAL
jgi:hypothetical protein